MAKREASANRQAQARSARRGRAMPRVLASQRFDARDDAWMQLAELIPQAAFRKDLAGRYVFANKRFCAWAGHASAEIIGRTDFEIFPGDLAELLDQGDRQAIAGGGAFQAQYRLPGLGEVRTSIARSPVRDDRGELAGLYGVLWDQAEDKTEHQEELENRIFLMQTLMDTVPDRIYFKDRASRFFWVNRSLADKHGYADPAGAVGKNDFDFFSGEHAGQAYADEQEIIRTGHPLINLEEKETFPDGSVAWASTTKMPLRDSAGRVIGTFGISRDITEKKRFEEQLERQAFTDPLTGMPNRALFINRLDHRFRRARRRGAQRSLFAVVYLDLDRFKGVNDSLGHEAGNELLIQFTRRLETCLRPGDTLARLGGDEFTILLEDIGNEEDATRVAERIQTARGAPFSVRGAELFCTASVGIALSSTGYRRPDDMLRDADTAMYRAKANGRARHEVFDADMHSKAVALLRLENELRRALERDQCQVYYQPIVDLGSRRLVAFEALVRWHHPRRGLLLPEAFISVAEETGVILPLGLWVLRQACQQTCNWQRKYPAQGSLGISVNMSTQQLAAPNFVDQVRKVLDETKLDAPCLTLELTESSLMHNMKTGVQAIERLHDLDVKLHIDDFGTGYSSLSYLQAFPVDALKVDRSFVSRMNSDAGQAEIVRAIVSLAQNLGMAVTAEGVETIEQLTALTDMHCTSAQGYYFSRPLPALEAEQLLARGGDFSDVKLDSGLA